MLPITPSNYHFFYSKWTKHLNNLHDKNQKNIYASKIDKELIEFGNSGADNTLVPHVKNLISKMTSQPVTTKVIINVLNEIQAEDNKLTL